MADALLRYFRHKLPTEIVSLTEPYLSKLENGRYREILDDPEARSLFGVDDTSNGDAGSISWHIEGWQDGVFDRLGSLLADRSKGDKLGIFFCIGYAAFLAFLQSTVTGPPLDFKPGALVFPSLIDEAQGRAIRQRILESLAIDGVAPFRLIPHVELLCIADAVMTCPPILKNVKGARWVKARIGFVHQRLLTETSSTLQNIIYDDLALVEQEVLHGELDNADADIGSEFLVERATVHTYHDLDVLARKDLELAKQRRHFVFALTGLLGKRTKFQEKDVSQLVVLARSREAEELDGGSNGINPQSAEAPANEERGKNGPDNLSLFDDTLLESITFTQKQGDLITIMDTSNLPKELAALDAQRQPMLQPLDSAILLSLASSITNTSPQDGLTREETLPYATRVLEGGSANWQVYTQALLLRSRIEGFRSRTVERGLLQLQVLVDQVIADTTNFDSGSDNKTAENEPTNFLPRAKDIEAAPVTERLRYIFQLASPTRWNLEAELATRWTELGGFRSALDIYERLEMWAEAALCWAATEQEDKARKIIRKQLFYSVNANAEDTDSDATDETWSGPPRDPPPFDAPRLYCILGDIDQAPEFYERAWEVSNQRYARAQRSLGRHYFATKNFVKAAEAYSKSLKANQLNHASWFALGCALLELEQFERAAEAFSRCVQLDDTDAESWSNLAAALLRMEPKLDARITDNGHDQEDDVEASTSHESTLQDIQRNQRQDALNALKRAATLKNDSARIWENVLIVAASVSPPDYASILAAQRKLIDLRGSTDGERCIDVEILDILMQHVISSSDTFDPAKPGIQRMAVKFIDESVVPLITGSAALWRIVSKLALWRNKPTAALDAEEKAWRAMVAQPAWETESEVRWNAVVEATVRLCDSYESLGPRERTEGMGSGTPVAKDWRFKARTAVRGIIGRGKASWEGTEGWDRLRDLMESLKG